MKSRSNLGKWIRAFFIVLLAVLMLICAISVFFILATADDGGNLLSLSNQFNLNRQPLSNDVSIDLVFPDQVGVYSRQAFTPLTEDSRHQLVANGSYTGVNGRLISLSVWRPIGWSADQVWQSGFRTLIFGDLAGQIDLHRDANFPYRYGRCIASGFVYHEFKWINSDWVITVFVSGFSPQEVNVQALIDFVNAYPH